MDLIFVHGALVRDGQWWWQRTADLLLARTGIRSRALELPSCGDGSPQPVAAQRVAEQSVAAQPGAAQPAAPGLVADAAALRAELDSLDDPGSAIVVGHSYGGTVIAEAGTHPAVRSLLYVSSYLPDIGQAQGMIMSGESDPVSISDNGDGTLSVTGYDASSFGARFLQDADTGTQNEAWSRVTAQAVGSFITPTTAAGWQGVDSTYLVCADDRSTSIGLQRFHAARATRSVEVPTGHHPFITRPDLVVAEIEALLDRS
ncbi:alpha/beta hydrolase [Subtercola boreus]|uniref:Alpha/beta hydrolase n=2 Tax=Subtercola boreus TaxID=120213 RepID=A0A3E0W4I2_9MICO|nr:alpha/beta hydrolase [Subtercola boreus]